MERNSVLMLARHESLMTVDKRMLRDNAQRPFQRFSFMDSGLKAAQGLAAAAESRLDLPGLVVCDIPLVDMSAAQFLSLIRLHAALRELPVLLLGEAKDLESEAELEKLQPVIRLARPYAAVDLEKALRDLAAQTTKKQPVARAEEDSAAFRAALKLMTAPRKESGPEELLRQGFAHLRRNSPFEARKAFQTVISRHPAFTAEALQGLAEVETKRGDSAAGRQLLYKAAIINLRAHNFKAAQSAFLRMEDLGGAESTGHTRAAKANPLYQAGAALLKNGHFDAAASAFWHGMSLTPDDHVLKHISRACQLTASPEKAAVSIAQAISVKSPSLAKDLRKGLLGEGLMRRDADYDAYADADWRDYGAVGNFLASVYTVARYTVQMYRQA